MTTTTRKIIASQPVSLLILRPAPTPSVESSWPPPPKALDRSPAPPCSRIRPMIIRHSGQTTMLRTKVRVSTQGPSVSGGDDRGEIGGLEAGAADEGAVDVGHRQQFLGVVGLDRAAVEDAHRIGESAKL